ncbi:MAG: hypothetical protein V1763_00040, partial [Parcubacteria group bacterium]
SVDPADVTVTQADQTSDYQAFGRSDSQPIQPFTGIYDWHWTWSSMDESIFNVTGNSDNTVNNATVHTLAKNGKTFVKATATIDTDTVSTESTHGTDTTGAGQIQVFICDNLWYPDYNNNNANWGNESTPDTLSNGGYVASYLYEKDYDIGLFYCRDFGKAGFNDDLPKLKLVTDSLIDPSASNLLAQYFFVRDDGWALDSNDTAKNDNATSDVVSLRIYKNPTALSPEAWYKGNVPNPAAETTAVNLDCITDDTGKYCFAGTQDGASLYMAAPNISDSTKLIYNNIYLLGYSRGANAATQNIYSQLVNFVKFNVTGADTIDKKLALRRDMVRLGDISYITDLLARYKATHANKVPAVDSGSYVRGQTLSVWPSWQSVLGGELGASLPTDPLNHFEWTRATGGGGGASCGKNINGNETACVATVAQCAQPGNCVNCGAAYDKKTCYNSIDLRFSNQDFDSNPALSALYSYRALTSTTYSLTNKLETATLYDNYTFVH